MSVIRVTSNNGTVAKIVEAEPRAFKVTGNSRGPAGPAGPQGIQGPAGNNAPSDHTLLSNIGVNTHAQIDTHIASVSNPHSVTAAQVGNTTAQWNANKLQGRDLISTAPTNGQAIIWNDSLSRWEPTTIITGGSVVDDTLTDTTHTWSSSKINTLLNGKVAANGAITGATKTKITYDAKGLVTAGADATTSDISEGTNLYYTDVRVRANRLDQLAAPTASVSLNSQKITNLLDPTLAQDAASKNYVDTQITSFTTPDATSSVKGKLQLTGDLGGTAASPTVPGLSGKEPTLTAGTTSQYYRGDKSWQTLNKTTVGLANVDNTSDINKPISTAAQVVFTDIENAISQKTFVTVGTSTGADYVATGTNDHTPIQNAINAVNAAGGGTVFIKAGTYNLGSPISLTGKSKIRLRGENLGTIFQIPQASLANFGFSFMITGDVTAADIIVEGIYFKGGYSGYTAPPANQGGGVNPQTRWLIQDCIIEDFNYFGVWLGSACTDSKVLRNRFIGPGRGPDHIGGGGANNVEIAGNIWESSIVGNAFDNTGGSNFNIHHNVNRSSHNFYLEAMDHIDVHHNIFTGSGNIAALSDNGYSPAAITNSSFIMIRNNQLNGGNISYKIDADAVKSSTLGGNVQITENTLESPSTYGILLYGYSSDRTKWGSGYLVANNIVHNANASNAATQNIGYGVINPSAINVAQLLDIVVSGNVCVDDRATPQQRYGIQVGQTFSPSTNDEPDRVTLIGNRVQGYVSGKVNIVSPTYTTLYTVDNQGIYTQGNITGATTFDRLNSPTITATLTGNITVTLASGQTPGEQLTLVLTQDATGSRTATWPATAKFAAGGSFTLSTAASAVDVITFAWDGTNWREISRALGAAASGTTWGSITGTLSSQTDLQTALNGKVTKTGDTMSGNLAITIPSAGNAVGLTVNQNDTTNNPNAMTVNNTGTGYTMLMTAPGGRTVYIGVQGQNTGVDTADYQFISNHADAVGCLTASERSATGSGKTLFVQNLGTGTGAHIQNSNALSAGTGTGLFVDHTGATGTGAQITRSGNSASAVTGVNINTTNAGAGAAYGLIVQGGLTGLGQTAPTAILHLKAGTATANTAPLKFTAGTNLTTAEAGAYEWDGTNLFISQTTGPTRKTLAYTDSNITGTAANVIGTVAVGNGGTGLTSAASGTILYASASNTYSSLALGTAGQVLAVNSGATAPAWQNQTVTTAIMVPQALGAPINTTTVTATATGVTYFLYLGKAMSALTTCTVRTNVTTGVATITWAEVGIFKGAFVHAGTTTMTRLGFTDVSTTFNTTGLKTTTVSLSGVSVGDDLWVCYGSSATTPFQIRGTVADEQQSGVVQSITGRPSTIAAATASTLGGATLVPGWLTVKI